MPARLVRGRKPRWPQSHRRRSREDFADARAELPVERVLSEIPEIRIAAQPFEVAVTAVERGVKRRGGVLALAGERVTACEVVVREGIVGMQPGEALVHL